MKYLFAAAVLVAGTFASFSAANAAGGCGPGWHRGPYGGCQPNRRAVVVRPAPVVVASSPLRRRGTARPRLPLRHRVALRTLPRLLSVSKLVKKPRSRGAFFVAQTAKPRRRSNDGARRSKGRECVASLPSQHWLTSSNGDGGASSGGGGDASPSACDGANPNADVAASPSAGGPSRDDGRGPSALLPA